MSTQSTGEPVTTETFRDVGSRVSNWGRWGPEDEIGTLNLIGNEEVIRAAQTVKRGQVISLGLPLDADGPIPPAGSGDEGLGRRVNPLHIMTELGHEARVRGDQRFCDDIIIMPLQAATQWDAVCHIIYDDKVYNGFSASEHITVDGASRCSIDKVSNGVVGRGVLLDVARHRGVEWMEMGDVIEPEELDEVAQAQGTEVLAGDIVLVRTGWRKMYTTTGSKEAFYGGEPGLGLRCADWLKEHDVAAICADNYSVEAVTQAEDGSWVSPECEDQVYILHMVATRDLGMMFGEVFDLEELGAGCDADGAYEFLFCAPALRVTGAVGSPLNPLAIK